MRKLLFGLVVTGTVLAAACGAAATSTSNPTPTVPSAATLPPAVPTSVPDATATPTPEPVATATPRPTATSTPAPTAPTPAPTATTAPEPAPTEEPDAEEPDTMEPEPTPTLEPTATSAPPPTQTPLPTSTPVPTATPAPSPTPSPTATQPVPVRGTSQVDITGQFRFSPANITVEAGDTVNWTVTGIGHTTTSGVPGAETGIWASGFKRVGESFAFTFEEEGESPYFCSIHPTMRGRVTVVGSGQVSTSEEEPAPTEPLSPAGYGGLDY